MPSLITASEFVEEALDDYHSPTTSTFVEKMGSCRQTIAYLEQSLDFDREGLSKMKKAIKSIYNNGIEQVENEQSLSKSLEKLGAHAMSDSEPDIGAAFIKFSIVTKELSSLQKALMQNLNNIIMFPLDNVLKGELKGVKGDLKKPFEKAWRDYEAKILKIEKEKKAQAKEAGLIRTEISSAEIAEEMDRERKAFQLQMCEYLIKVNDIKSKKGVELLQHLVDYYHLQINYFQDGLDNLKHFNTYIDELSNKLVTIKSSQDEERKQLTEIKNLLNNGENGLNVNTSNSSTNSTSSTNNANVESNGTGSKKEKSVYNLHQLQGNKHYGYSKSGYLLKKSEGKMKMKVWQKRKCQITGFNADSKNPASFLHIYHSDESKSPVKINLLTCQVKIIPDDKCSFDLISYSRTYHFQAEDELDAEAWISVLLNCKEAILKKEFDNNKTTNKSNNEDYLLTETLNELRKNIIRAIIKLPGNQQCVDCNSTKDATWLSTNFGCICCIECSGIHRELGTHVSRIHSLTLDNIGISLLLLARNMSNNAFNSVYESNLNENEKINSKSSMEERCLFIKSKYVKRKFVKNLSSGDVDILKSNLERAILNKNIYQILQCYAENNQCINWALPLFQETTKDNALHLAVAQEDNSTLHLVDFLIQNSQNINHQNLEGNTALHLCVVNNRSEPLKLLLRSKAKVDILNKDEKTALQLAKELNRTCLIELFEQAVKNKKSLVFENLNINWNLQMEETSTDFSDEDLNEEKMTAKEYFDWLLNSRTNQFDQLNSRKKYSAETSSIISNDALIYKNNHLNNQTDSRSSSVLEGQLQSIQQIGNNSVNKLNNAKNQQNSSSSLRQPPPLPPHKPQQLSQLSGQLSLSNNNNNQNLSNLNSLSNKEQFLKSKPILHSKTISDIGIKPTLGHRKNGSMDLQISNQKNSYLNDKNLKRRTYIDSCTQLNLDTNLVLNKRPAIPPLKSVVNHSNSQSNLISSNFNSNQFINSLNNNNILNNNCKTDNKLIRRKQTVYIENRHLSNGQSFESLPSSDDLNNSNNSGSNHHHHNLINNVCPNQQVTITYDAKFSPVPIPPPRRRDSTTTKKCVALFDCEKDQPDELEFKQNEIIEILKEETSDPQWMYGRIGNREGVFPISFVQILN